MLVILIKSNKLQPFRWLGFVGFYYNENAAIFSKLHFSSWTVNISYTSDLGRVDAAADAVTVFYARAYITTIFYPALKRIFKSIKIGHVVLWLFEVSICSQDRPQWERGCARRGCASAASLAPAHAGGRRLRATEQTPAGGAPSRRPRRCCSDHASSSTSTHFAQSINSLQSFDI